jgi:hypothetical protein
LALTRAPAKLTDEPEGQVSAAVKVIVTTFPDTVAGALAMPPVQVLATDPQGIAPPLVVGWTAVP